MFDPLNTLFIKRYLNYFDFITPCGIQNKQVTSLEKELGQRLSMDEVKKKVVSNFENVFEAEIDDYIYMRSQFKKD